MGRRLQAKIGSVLAVVGLCLATGMAAVPSQDEPPPTPSPSSAPAAPAPKKAQAKPKAAPPGELDGPIESASNLGPTPPAYGRDEASKEAIPDLDLPPPASALPAPAALPPATALPAPTALPAEKIAGTLDDEIDLAQATGKAAPAARPQAAGARAVPASTPLAAPAGDGLPGASTEAPGRPAAPTVGASRERESEPSFVLPSERLPLGRQSVGLTVDVVAPQVLNINQTTSLKIVVRNTGQADAIGVVVRDELPETLTLLSSQPEATRIDALLSWSLGTIAAGSERVITLSVKPIKVGSFDHAATVTMLAGGKSRTLVREPKLKVEQSAAPGKVLRGQPVQFKIAVSNPGDGPVRNVTVQAKLSPGLRHDGEPNDQNLFEQTIAVIAPGERVALDTLVADTLQRGEQSCLIVATSPDVVEVSADARSLQTITVVEPELKVSLKGPEKRFTDMLAPYELTLENKGTAPARNIRAQITVPFPGKLTLSQLPPGASFNQQSRKLSWTRPQLDPGEKAVLPFSIKMGGPGVFTLAAEAQADGVKLDKSLFQTDVEGLADVNFVITEKRRVVDVEGETVYTIRIDNAGTKEATQVLVSALLSDNIAPDKTSGTDEREAQYNPATHEVVFPTIERILPGKTVELGIRVKALKPGIASCRVFLVHQEMTEKIDAVARFTVVPTRR